MLNIRCNAGFHRLEMKRRGARRVIGIDTDARYLEQTCFAAEIERSNIEFIQMPVWDVALLQERLDLVIFMGVMYHLRNPLLAINLIHEPGVKDLLHFQSMQRGSKEIVPVQTDFDFGATGQFD